MLHHMASMADTTALVVPMVMVMDIQVPTDPAMEVMVDMVAPAMELMVATEAMVVVTVVVMEVITAVTSVMEVMEVTVVTVVTVVTAATSVILEHTLTLQATMYMAETAVTDTMVPIDQATSSAKESAAMVEHLSTTEYYSILKNLAFGTIDLD